MNIKSLKQKANNTNDMDLIKIYVLSSALFLAVISIPSMIF